MIMKKSVAPHTGAWIEIVDKIKAVISDNVAPHTGAWIEIDYKWSKMPP